MTEIVEIERMGYCPEAVAHLASGKAVFVRGAAPGDIAEVDVVEDKPNFSRAKITRLVRTSDLRDVRHRDHSPNPAEEAMAPWSHLSYEAQLAAKEDNVRSALKRNAHLSQTEIDKILKPIVPSRNQTGYRNKLEFAARPDAQGRITLGVNAQGSHDFIPLKAAPLGNELIEKSPKALSGALRYLCGDYPLGIYRVGIRGSVRTGSIQIALWTPPSSFPRGFSAKVLTDAVDATSVVRVIADEGSSRMVKRVEVLGGEGFWHEAMQDDLPSGAEGTNGINDFDFHVSAPSFFQVNTAQAQNLVELVMQGLKVAPGAKVADLYAGVGTFSFPLAAAGADVCAIELEGSSSRDFKTNADLNMLDAEMICDDVGLALPRLGHMDAMVVDPPRAGLEKKVISQIGECSPESLAYVSCDPQTMSRDVARLKTAGYSPESLTPVDMFPQTFHLECVAVFSKDI